MHMKDLQGQIEISVICLGFLTRGASCCQFVAVGSQRQEGGAAATCDCIEMDVFTSFLSGHPLLAWLQRDSKLQKHKLSLKKFPCFCRHL